MQRYAGGGLEAGGANRVLALKKWREAVFAVELGAKTWEFKKLVAMREDKVISYGSRWSPS